MRSVKISADGIAWIAVKGRSSSQNAEATAEEAFGNYAPERAGADDKQV